MAGGEDVEEEQRLERLEVPGLEQEALELRVEVPLQRLIPRREDGNFVPPDGVLQRLDQQCLLHQLRQLRAVRVQQRHQHLVQQLPQHRLTRRWGVAEGNVGSSGAVSAAAAPARSRTNRSRAPCRRPRTALAAACYGSVGGGGGFLDLCSYQLPSHFEAGRRAEFHPEYMESVAGAPRDASAGGMVVRFAIAPGFRLGNAGVVYLVPPWQRMVESATDLAGLAAHRRSGSSCILSSS